MDCSLLHNVVTDLLTSRGCINIYRWHSCRFHSIKTHMDVEVADGGAGSVWFGYRYANYICALCTSEVRRRGKDLCTWHAEKSQPFDRKTIQRDECVSHTFPHTAKQESLKHSRLIKHSLFSERVFKEQSGHEEVTGKLWSQWQRAN